MSPVEKSTAARAVADVSGGTIVAVVEIGVEPERVFQALTRPEDITRWWGSEETYRTTHHQADLRVGGSWKSTGRRQDGKPFCVEGEFLELVPPSRLVMTWRPDWDSGHTTTVRYTLEPTATGTRLTVRHDGFEGRTGACQGHTRGWEMVLGLLARHLEGARPDAPRRAFFCRLIPPRSTFAMDMSPAEREAMQQHVAYWTQALQRGDAVVFGPVLDPKGPWGVGIVLAQDEADLGDYIAQDPAIRAKMGMRYETLPMAQAVTRA